MNKIKFSIGNKILSGFLLLILIFTINAAISVLTINKNDSLIEDMSEVITPSVNALQEFKFLVTRSKMLVTNWVYLQSNEEDKEALKELHNFDYPELKEELTKLKMNWGNEELQSRMDSVFIDFEVLLQVEQEKVMSQLVTFDHYEDPFIKLTAAEAIESEVLPQSSQIMESLEKISVEIYEQDVELEAIIIDASDSLARTTMALAIVTIVLGLLGAIWMARSITKPINFIKEIVIKLGKGELPDEDQNHQFNRDEIGEMATAVDNLVSGLRSTSSFAESIGKGNYDAEFEPLSENDVLGNALIEMKNNLYEVAEEDKKRNWSTSGLAKFGDILRSNNDNIERLSDDIIVNLVKYMDCNQGGLFIVNDNDSEEPYLHLIACYAWDRKKYVDQKVYLGEGLTGQAWMEKDTIYITEVPEDYITITSGLGASNPKSILITPLKINDEVFGVIELASFREFTSHEVEFVEKIAESIASTISSVKINEKTQRLLEESTEMTEQMRSQEEEMRQNMEELQATQEEMQRNQIETQGIIEAVNVSLAKAEYKPTGEMIDANDKFLTIFGYELDEVQGRHHAMFVTEEEKDSDAYRLFWEDVRGGISKTGEFERKKRDGSSIWIRANYSPIKNSNGELTKVLCLAVDITEYKVKLEEIASQS
ncbi:PAS domain S-box protein [Fulvivirgaceae bacterium BMA10]|uniref:PAS domain S-box protein n=1 Tax=Splendidivirga corallicola TaxID=3051826 RepID=A0ABT8KPA8_9BACT|nr:PAS domain S-box protein [Fulvivirgaceae bacterium BMA10]